MSREPADSMRNVLTVLLAGGVGQRLFPLTRHRAKPAVVFGGYYRLIDFTLSNCLHSQCRRILVLVQYKYLSLSRHIQNAWNVFHRELGEYIEIIPPQQRVSNNWYLGTADAIYQNFYSIDPVHPKYVLVVSGDHVYKMDYRRMVAFHRNHDAELTVAVKQVPVDECRRFGIVETDADYRVTGFVEKPERPTALCRANEHCLASMGIYVFNTSLLRRACMDDAKRRTSHDFGHDVIPRLIDSNRVYAYPFEEQTGGAEAYWKDVGTLDSYWEANMDLVEETPAFDLYDTSWPIHTFYPHVPPAKFVYSDEARRSGLAIDSIVSPGCVIAGGSVVRTVLSPEVRIGCFADVEESVVMHGVRVGKRARIRRALIEKNIDIPDNTMIGFDPGEDRRRFRVTERGIVVVDNPDIMRRHTAPAGPVQESATGLPPALSAAGADKER